MHWRPWSWTLFSGYRAQGQRQLTDAASSTATAVGTTTATAMSRVHAFIRWWLDAVCIYFSLTHSPCVEITRGRTSSMTTAIGTTAWQKTKQNSKSAFICSCHLYMSCRTHSVLQQYMCTYIYIYIYMYIHRSCVACLLACFNCNSVLWFCGLKLWVTFWWQ